VVDNYSKTDPTKRIVAFIVDALVYLVIYIFLFFWARVGDYFAWILAGGYLLVKDGLHSGQSLGKKVFGLRVVNVDMKRPGDITDSVKRNLIFFIPGLFRFVPFLGSLIATVVFAIELYFIFNDVQGLRWGDNFARTMVVEEKID